ncbi:hypothetical protein [Clostridium hydrogenum]|uniref:hypothetical protein n=1 Tax=Clostridium hydrogenum TaxID=2855764 RepID=UPI001F35433F|nr:hypothetical protein [Clostridium hydrogenum]
MERLFLKKIITAIIFIIMIFTLFFINLKNIYTPLLKENFTSSSLISSLENITGNNIYEETILLELRSYFNKLIYRNEDSNFEIIKDKNGSLSYNYSAPQNPAIKNFVKNIKALKDKLKNKTTKFAYIMPLDKSVKNYFTPDDGIPYKSANGTANTFLKFLNSNNIATIDLRKNLNKSGISNSNLFFKTDEHEKIGTSFFEFTQLVNILKTKYNLNLDNNNFFTNKNNYNFITYKNSFLGSIGAKTGIAYSGTDDFTLIYPKYETNYECTFKTENGQFITKGRFEDSLLNIPTLRSNNNIYSTDTNKYSTYLFGNQNIVHIVNKNNPTGPKILFINDSFLTPTAAFLSTVCSEVYLVDFEHYSGNIADFENSVKTDFVFVSFAPENLTEDFFKGLAK